MDEPAVSVLIASVNGQPMIEECLAALEAQTAARRAEVVVADATDEETRTALRARFPSVRLLTFPKGSPIPYLRTAAFDASRGRIVAVTEDHCLPEPNWIEEICSSLEGPGCEGVAMVGGAVENGSRDRLVDWAVYFCEYARYMRPVPDGPHADVPGVNVAYRRGTLTPHRGLLESGFWEGIVHPILIAEGARIVSSSRLVVSHKKRFGFGYFLSQRFHYSRYYAATRAANWPGWKRVATAIAMPVLPPLLFARTTREVARKRRNAAPYLAALPILGVFWVAWAVGEAAGSLFGAGDSLARIE